MQAENLDAFSQTLHLVGIHRAYAGYNRLLKRQESSIRLAHCGAHARRKLFDVAKAGKATPIADERIVQIRELYRIEKEIRGQSPDTRSAARQERSRPVIDQIELWLTQTLTAIANCHKQSNISSLMPWNYAADV